MAQCICDLRACTAQHSTSVRVQRHWQPCTAAQTLLLKPGDVLHMPNRHTVLQYALQLSRFAALVLLLLSCTAVLQVVAVAMSLPM